MMLVGERMLPVFLSGHLINDASFGAEVLDDDCCQLVNHVFRRSFDREFAAMCRESPAFRGVEKSFCYHSSKTGLGVEFARSQDTFDENRHAELGMHHRRLIVQDFEFLETVEFVSAREFIKLDTQADECIE